MISLSAIQTIFVILSAVILFVFSLQGFSKEVQRSGEERLKLWLQRATDSRLKGFTLGALFTGVLQSSSAVSAMTVALVNAQTIPLYNSFSILLGTNLGTTTTAWMVSFKLTGIGPYFIVLGALLGFLPNQYRIIGKSIFYLGFIFLCLNLISDSVSPFQNNPLVLDFLKGNSIIVNILGGLLVTALVQSSSVVTGLAVLLTQQGVLSIESALAIILGSNVGTTATALIAGYSMGGNAKICAKANLIFNLSGVLLVLLIFPFYSSLITYIATTPEQSVAFGHLFLNLIIAVVFLAALKPVSKLLIKD